MPDEVEHDLAAEAILKARLYVGKDPLDLALWVDVLENFQYDLSLDSVGVHGGGYPPITFLIHGKSGAPDFVECLGVLPDVILELLDGCRLEVMLVGLR